MLFAGFLNNPAMSQRPLAQVQINMHLLNVRLKTGARLEGLAPMGQFLNPEILRRARQSGQVLNALY